MADIHLAGITLGDAFLAISYLHQRVRQHSSTQIVWNPQGSLSLPTKAESEALA